ncbi:DNA-binding transcriptional regulator, LysR family [Amycolatopsis arida]|uniref:DNA-binding transcriptional regulator, LysR family n=1 Tax=Amycolatopsis arida TaxID=587909 RepID=A0A1I5LG25_9PSEU|nr:LysR family transcriptional regulator [Amycolatopsis arida]TDX93712.1 DNA-binding transcriptional LysR family regulator [Amycolatopsis arida]SFO96309.1 DNA-binding transcriptional regulator, LysR family [Amycolatopsis arida]
MLDPRRLRTFTTVAAAGSLARAAEQLAFTPPAVSQQIAALERDLGTTLLERTSRGVRLTEAGRALLALATDVLARLDVAEATIKNLAREYLGPLRVAAFTSAGRTLLPRAFTTLRARHPRLRLSLTEVEPPDALDLLTAGDVDIAVGFSYDGAPQPAVPAVRVARIARDPLRVVVPPDHPLAGRNSVALTELADEPWIVGQPGAVCTMATLHACHGAGFEPRVRLNLGDFATVCGMVGAGFGVALVPELALPARPPEVRVLPIADDPLARHLWVAHRPAPEREHASLVTDAIAHLAAAAGTTAPR